MDDEFERIIVPEVADDVQIQIKNKIVAMYESKALSKCLLDIAKCGVEMAIEKDEITAEKWIRDELEKIEAKIDT